MFWVKRHLDKFTGSAELSLYNFYPQPHQKVFLPLGRCLNYNEADASSAIVILKYKYVTMLHNKSQSQTRTLKENNQ